MESGFIVTGVISALLAIILTLAGVLKLYMPWWQQKNGIPSSKNPGNHETLVEIRQGLQELNQVVTNHVQMSVRDHTDTMAILQRIETHLIK